jgi:hypothetical protein
MNQTLVEHLITQSELLQPVTERLLRAAGVRRGMHVLDLGCGLGDVSILAAGLVGPNGLPSSRRPATAPGAPTSTTFISSTALSTHWH